jgi:tRNA(Ile)-lysidine synthetase-like protein
MFEGATGIVVAVSGGPDSVALLDMLARLISEDGIRGSEQAATQCRLHIAHLDHILRGPQSKNDAQFVRALADKMGLEITISAVDIRAEAEAAGRGIEETAREKRYEFLLSVATETGCDRIAVGHTMSDQAETFVMRLIRGAGVRGLAAMRPIRLLDGGTGRPGEGPTSPARELAQSPRRPVSPSPLVIRPLLCLTRDEVEEYCCQRKLEFRTDETNQDSQYTRNRIRSEIIPAMMAINPRVVSSIARAAENLASDLDALDSLLSPLMNKARIERSLDPRWDEGTVAYSVTALLKQPPGMRRRMIIEAIRLARDARAAGRAAGEVSATHISAVETLLAPAASGKRILLPGGLEAWREFDALVLRQSAFESAGYQIVIRATDVDVQVAGFDFALQRDVPGALFKSVVETTQHEKERTGFDWTAVALTDCTLPDSLIIRPRQSGERAHVVGQRRTIKLKNVMIDHRIPSSRRVDWPLVTTPDGRYIWSPGLPPAVEFAACDESQRLAILRASAI